MRVSILNFLFVIFLILFLITFFSLDSYKSIKDIHPKILEVPVQQKITESKIIKFTKDGFSYTLTPLYEYDISGLVVSRLKYNSWYSLSRVDSVFPMDICLIWGDNVKKGFFRNKSLSFKQDFRFCLYSHSGDLTFNEEELGNNHLVIESDRLLRAVQKIKVGDQIRLKGKLVNVKAVAVGNVRMYEPKTITWFTSTSRFDKGAGACEVLFLEDIEILKANNSASFVIFSISKYALILIFLLKIFRRVFYRYLSNRHGIVKQ
jgi:hypothetical protein